MNAAAMSWAGQDRMPEFAFEDWLGTQLKCAFESVSREPLPPALMVAASMLFVGNSTAVTHSMRRRSPAAVIIDLLSRTYTHCVSRSQRFQAARHNRAHARMMERAIRKQGVSWLVDEN